MNVQLKSNRVVQLFDLADSGGVHYLGAVNCKEPLTDAEFQTELEHIKSLREEHNEYDGPLDLLQWLASVHGYTEAELPNVGWIFWD